MMYFYNGAFINGAIHNVPNGAVKLSDEQYDKFYSAAAQGFKLIVEGGEVRIGENAYPFDPVRELKVIKDRLRSMRAPMLDALTGIAGRATRSGDSALADEADSMAEQLLQLTDDPALNAAQTVPDMEDAGLAAYKRIAAAASPALRVVFREITGA